MNVSNSPRGRGHSPICPIRICAAEQGIYNFTIKRLEQGAVFLDWESFKECEDFDQAMSGVHFKYQ